jgi:hypothetical protein
MAKKSVVLVALIAGIAVVGLLIARDKTSSKASIGQLTEVKDQQSSGGHTASGTGQGLTAIEKAAQAKKYLFVFFWKEADSNTTAMRKIFQETMKKVADRADALEIKADDPAEGGIVKKFEVERAPMPLALALAPNGAITGGFPTRFDEQLLLKAFATPCTQKVMKGLQESKLVLLCVQNAKTKSNDSAMKGVRDFQADPKFSGATQVVMLDPADAAEAEFLRDLQIDAKTPEAITAFLAPPGVPLGKFAGATTKDELMTTLQKASSGCCPGGACGPGGCPPKQ